MILNNRNNWQTAIPGQCYRNHRDPNTLGWRLPLLSMGGSDCMSSERHKETLSWYQNSEPSLIDGLFSSSSGLPQYRATHFLRLSVRSKAYKCYKIINWGEIYELLPHSGLLRTSVSDTDMATELTQALAQQLINQRPTKRGSPSYWNVNYGYGCS